MTDLRVLLVSTSYPVDDQDWRGRFIASMVSAVSKKVPCLRVWAPLGKLPPGVDTALSAQDKKWLSRLLTLGGIAHLLRTRRLYAVIIVMNLLHRLWRVYKKEGVDVIHINWLQNSLPLALEGKKKTPVLVTVLGSDLALLKLPGMVTALRTALKKRPAIIAPNASWMVSLLQQHFGSVAEIRSIPFGVDSRWFNLNRQPATPHKWIAVTRITAGKIGDLFSWGAGVFGSERELHLFGPMQEETTLPEWVIWHGPTHPDELAENWFPYVTGLISLSRHSEGRPQVLLEAMAAGLPVVVSDLSAHTDVVIHGKTGWVADSPTSLIKALQYSEQKDANQWLGENARSHIRDNIGDWDNCADRYITAYLDLLAQAHHA